MTAASALTTSHQKTFQVADCIMLSVYVGMNNEFFVAIPKRKTIVTYSVPGVSDDGPNVPGQII